MDKQEWHAWRAQGIGASDAAVVLKQFPFGKTPHMLWEEKVMGTVQASNKAMDHGNRHEERALLWAQKQLGVELVTQQRATHPSMPWMRATLDAVNDEKRILIEAKCPYNLENHYKVKASGKAPDIYFPQLQHQMKVKEWDNGIFFSYNWENEDDSILIEVKIDPDYVDNLVREEYAFFQYVVDRVPPPLTDLDYKKRGPDWIATAQQRIDIRNAMKDLKKKDEELQKRLIELSEETSSEGGGFRFTKYVSKGSIDYGAAISHLIEELQVNFPEMQFPSDHLEIFRKDPTTSWKLT